MEQDPFKVKQARNACCVAGAVELRNEVGRLLGMDLPGTLIFDYPTISAMSAMLTAKLAPKEPAAAPQSPSRCVSLMPWGPSAVLFIICTSLCCKSDLQGSSLMTLLLS